MYDIIIIGGGFAGLTAAIYTARYNMKTLVVAGAMGGVITESVWVENYPGFKGISGVDLMDRFAEQCKYLGAELREEEVGDVGKKNGHFAVKTNKGAYEGKRIILATGSAKRHLNVPGDAEFAGKGVSYCATCDAAFFKNKIACVAGGGNSAVEAALVLAEHASKVYLIYRGDKFWRADPVTVKKAEANKKIQILYKANIKEIKGDKVVRSIVLDNGKEMPMDGVFVEIGADPVNWMAKKLGVALSETGKIIVDPAQKTNVKNVYAAGDLTTGSNEFEQGVCAASEGAIAAESAYRDSQEDKK